MKPRSKISKNIEDFAGRSTVHGISYILDKTISLPDRLLWLIVCLGSALLATFLIYSSYTEWKENPVITTLKALDKPVTDLTFPAVTICAAGQHMGNVERVLYHNFKKWEQTQQNTVEEMFGEYLEETFQIREQGTSILDILNTMISPSDEASGANTVRRNVLACSALKNRRKRSVFEESTSNKTRPSPKLRSWDNLRTDRSIS